MNIVRSTFQHSRKTTDDWTRPLLIPEAAQQHRISTANRANGTYPSVFRGGLWVSRPAAPYRGFLFFR